MTKALFLLICIGCGVNSYSQSLPTLPVDATESSSLFFKALHEENANLLKSLLSEDFSITGIDGQLVTKNVFIEAISEGYLKVDSGMLFGALTRDYGNVGVVTGTWNATGLLQNVRFQNDLAYMVVAVKTGGSWKVSAVQLTPVR